MLSPKYMSTTKALLTKAELRAMVTASAQLFKARQHRKTYTAFANNSGCFNIQPQSLHTCSGQLSVPWFHPQFLHDRSRKWSSDVLHQRKKDYAHIVAICNSFRNSIHCSSARTRFDVAAIWTTMWKGVQLLPIKLGKGFTRTGRFQALLVLLGHARWSTAVSGYRLPWSTPLCVRLQLQGSSCSCTAKSSSICASHSRFCYTDYCVLCTSVQASDHFRSTWRIRLDQTHGPYSRCKKH